MLFQLGFCDYIMQDFESSMVKARQVNNYVQQANQDVLVIIWFPSPLLGEHRFLMVGVSMFSAQKGVFWLDLLITFSDSPCFCHVLFLCFFSFVLFAAK